MDADSLLELVAQVDTNHRRQAPWHRRAIFFARRLAGTFRWRSAQRSIGKWQLKTKLRETSLASQVQFINRTVASMDDWQVDLQERHAKPSATRRGSGKWKQRTPEECLRIGFANPMEGMRQLARSLKPRANHRFVADVSFTCASILREKQLQALAQAHSSPADYGVVQVLFDEWQHRLRLRAPGPHQALVSSVLSSHGRIVLKMHDGTRCEEELVFEPVNMAATSAASMWGAWRQQFPPLLWRWFDPEANADNLPTMMCVTLGCDRCSANEMLVAHVAEQLPPNAFLLPGFCKQHATAGVLVAITRRLQILNPVYCMAKRLRHRSVYSRYLQGIRAALEKHVKHIRGHDDPQWRPLQRHILHSHNVVHLLGIKSKYNGQLAEVSPDVADGPTAREKHATALLKHCCGDWNLPEVVFWDPEDKFTSRAEVCSFIFDLLMQMGYHLLGNPAENKWLSVYPMMCSLVGMMAFHSVFKQAIRQACLVEGNGVQDVSDISDSELVGRVTAEGWFRQERRRDLKIARWMEHPDAQFHAILFVTVTSAIMRLHFTLFEHAQTSPFGKKQSLLFRMLGEQSPVRAVLEELWAMLVKSDRLGMLESSYGRFATWSCRRKAVFREVVVMAIGELERRLVRPLRDPPIRHLGSLVRSWQERSRAPLGG